MIVYLTGIPGAGKSTVGRRLGKILHQSFLDYDNETPRSWQDSMQHGEFVPDDVIKSFFPIFIEKAKKLHEKGDIIVAVTVVFPEQIEQIRASADQVYIFRLQADQQTFLQRVSQRSHFFGANLLKEAFRSNRFDMQYDCILVDASKPLEEVVASCLQHIKAFVGNPHLPA